MKLSTERILTTHTGSLPRPAALVELLNSRERGEEVDSQFLDEHVREAVDLVLSRQAESGVDVVNDGEQSKNDYSRYIRQRLTGFDGETDEPVPHYTQRDFPDYARVYYNRARVKRPMCTGPIQWKDRAPLLKDIENLNASLGSAPHEEVFMSAASPGVITGSIEDRYFNDHEAYVYALADVMKEEYDEIHRAGFLLQVDCPDLAMGRNSQAFIDMSLNEFKRVAAIHVEALNHALRDIPTDRMRMHVCWGNAAAPHNRDVPLKEIIDVVLRARPAAVSFEGANPRHAHEWTVFREIELPDDKVIMPGVIDSTTNYIEHPELVAQRIVAYAEGVGRERVIASTDCGLQTTATTTPRVHPEIAWAKLASMAEGASLATEQLWGS